MPEQIIHKIRIHVTDVWSITNFTSVTKMVATKCYTLDQLRKYNKITAIGLLCTGHLMDTSTHVPWTNMAETAQANKRQRLAECNK